MAYTSKGRERGLKLPLKDPPGLGEGEGEGRGRGRGMGLLREERDREGASQFAGVGKFSEAPPLLFLPTLPPVLVSLCPLHIHAFMNGG